MKNRVWAFVLGAVLITGFAISPTFGNGINCAKHPSNPNCISQVSPTPSPIPSNGALMSFPQISDSDTKNGVVTSNSSPWTLTYPTNLVSGDLIVALLATDGNTATATWPNGWITTGDSSSSASTILIGKFKSDGTETGTFDVTLGAKEQGGWRVFRITGWEGTLGTSFNNIGNYGSAYGNATVGDNSTPDPLEAFPSWGSGSVDTLWIAAIAVDTSRTISVYPLSDRNTSDVSGGAGGATLGICTSNSAVTSLNPGTFTISASDQWAAVTIAIRPAAAAASRVPYVKLYPQLLAH